MGKRVPTKNHRKLKSVDPFFKGQTLGNKNRFSNNPPEDDDHQEVPKNVKELMHFKKNKNKIREKKKRKKIKNDFVVVVEDGDESVEESDAPCIIQPRKNETTSQLLQRLQQSSNSVAYKAKKKQDYGDFYHIKESDTTEVINKAKTVTPKRKKRKHKGKNKMQKKDEDEEQELEFQNVVDHVKFGEVVLAPPSFTCKPRKASETGKAGKKDLVLKQFLDSSSQQVDDAPQTKVKFAPKLKNLTAERRQVIERERVRAMQMYRKLKSKKSQNT